MKKEQMPNCDPCEQNFERKVNELVKEGKTPTHMEHAKRESEVKAAFESHHTTDHKAEHRASSHKVEKM